MDAYTPAGMVSQLTDAVGVILPWVGAAIAPALLLLFAFLGIRAGFNFFREVAGERAEARLWSVQRIQDGEVLAQATWQGGADIDVWGAEYHETLDIGYAPDDAKDFADLRLAMYQDEQKNLK